MLTNKLQTHSIHGQRIVRGGENNSHLLRGGIKIGSSIKQNLYGSFVAFRNCYAKGSHGCLAVIDKIDWDTNVTTKYDKHELLRQ